MLNYFSGFFFVIWIMVKDKLGKAKKFLRDIVSLNHCLNYLFLQPLRQTQTAFPVIKKTMILHYGWTKIFQKRSNDNNTPKRFQKAHIWDLRATPI